MQTGLIKNWLGNPLEIGPMYPFVGLEMVFFVVSFALAILYQIADGTHLEKGDRVQAADVRCRGAFHILAHRPREQLRALGSQLGGAAALLYRDEGARHQPWLAIGPRHAAQRLACGGHQALLEGKAVKIALLPHLQH